MRTARTRLHLTQAELAKRVGVSRAAIAELEAGRIQQPRAAVFARLSAVLGIPAALLLAATGVGGAEEAATIAELEADDLVAMAAGMGRWSNNWNPLAEIARPLTTPGQQAFWANGHV